MKGAGSDSSGSGKLLAMIHLVGGEDCFAGRSARCVDGGGLFDQRAAFGG